MLFSNKKTNFKGGGLVSSLQLQTFSNTLQKAPRFIAPRKLDFRDMCIQTSNQFNTSHCAGYSTAGYIEVKNWIKNFYPEQVDGEKIYKEAKRLDNNSFDGTSLESATQAAINLNLINGKARYVKRDIDEMKFAIHANSVFICGFLITDEWNSVNKKTGDIANFKGKAKGLGGHAVLCFSGDTKVALLDGRNLSFVDLEKIYGQKSFWVYSCDESGKIVPGLAHSVRKTGNKKTIKVKLDNGREIKCTEDHLFLMRSGEYKKACELKPMDSLMPLYRNYHKYGYESILQPYSEKWELTHRSFSNLGEKEIREMNGKKIVCHHVDFNKNNNTPENLKIITWEDHTKIHSQNTILLNNYARSEKGRECSRNGMSKNWDTPSFIEKMEKVNSENGKKVSESLKKENRCGFQSFPKEILINNGRNIKNRIKKHSEKTKALISEIRIKKHKEDNEFRKKMAKATGKTISRYNEMYKNGEVELTESQINARRKNAINLNKKRWGDRKKEKINHKVISIVDGGFEDVYDLTVESYHNFALSDGVFVHNCCGFDEIGLYIQNSWGMNWGIWGFARIPWEQAFKQCIYGMIIV